MKLHSSLSHYWNNLQISLLPWLEQSFGKLSVREEKLVSVLELARIEEHVFDCSGGRGRPPKERAAIARAFVAKSIYDCRTTRLLIDLLHTNHTLRRLCGWDRTDQLPSESTFSRAFGEFAQNELPQRIHDSIIEWSCKDRIIGHISRDSTSIPAREKAVKKDKKSKPANKRGRPRKGETRPAPPPTLIERQMQMNQAELLASLPTACDVGTKKNSKGYMTSWRGYKLHLDVADGDIPVSCVLTSASLHDSQAAIPLAHITASKVTNLYDLADAAYDVPQIRQTSINLGHKSIIDINPRRNKLLKQELDAEKKRQKLVHYKSAEDVRYNQRSSVERVNGRIKDDFGGSSIRVKGHKKVMCHLMFGIVALTIEQIIRLTI